MARLRYNGLTAELGAALTSGDTTITFAAALTSAAGAVPTITGSDYIPLTILDATGAVSEIVSLTAYTTAATTGTITRAQESTTAAAHAIGDGVVHGVTIADFTGAGSGDATWTVPTLTNSWVDFGTGFATTAYRKDGQGFVHLKGVVKGGATGTVAFTLPAGYRPGSIRMFGGGTSGSGVPRIDVGTDGTVTIRGVSASTVAMSVDGITFLAEA